MSKPLKNLPRGLTWDQKRQQYRVQFTSRHTRPKKRYKERLPPKTTKRQAEEYLAKLRESDRLGQLLWPGEREAEQPSEMPTVSQFAIDTYLPHCRAINSPRTVESKADYFASLAPWFGDVPIDEITKALVHEYQVERKAEGVRARTVNLGWAYLRHMINYAHEIDAIPHPAPRVKMLPERDKRETKALTEGEAERALRYAYDRADIWYALTLFLLHTGARWGDVRPLRWDNVDLDRAVVHFRGSHSKHGRERDVPLLPEVVDALERLPREHDLVFARRKRLYGDWIPLHRDPRCLSDRYPWESLDGDLRVGPHTFRHTFATWRLQNGGEMQEVSTLLGHADISLTVNIYGHLKASDFRQTVECGPRPNIFALQEVANG